LTVYAARRLTAEQRKKCAKAIVAWYRKVEKAEAG